MLTMAEAWVAANAGKFLPGDMVVIRQKLENMDESQVTVLTSVGLKDPVVALLLSIFLGGLGIDRFYTGNIGLGILKLLTCGVFGILYLIDLFLIMGAAKKANFKAISPRLGA